MLYNLKENKPKTSTLCMTCEYYDKKLKKCNGLDKICFEMDKLGNLRTRAGLIIKKEKQKNDLD